MFVGTPGVLASQYLRRFEGEANNMPVQLPSFANDTERRLFGVHCIEIVRQAEQGGYAWEAVDKGGMGHLFRESHAMLAAAANIAKIFKPPRENDAAKRQYAEKRGDTLSTAFAAVLANTPIFQDRTIRNHLEHFDVRIDDWVQLHAAATEWDDGAIAIGPQSTTPTRAQARHYDTGTGVLTVFGDSINLKSLARELADLGKEARAALEAMKWEGFY